MLIKYLDGGMIYELNKIYKDNGEYAMKHDSKLILSIYLQYISLGCHYITTFNYGFKPLKSENWKQLNLECIDFFIENQLQIPIFGCIPPYYDSYTSGPINKYVIEFYTFLVDNYKYYISSFIFETCVDMEHIECLLNIIKTNSPKKKCIISIYPNGNINKNNIQNLINNYEDYIEGILINCCSYLDMIQYFIIHISTLDIPMNIKLGFYCNKIHEHKYKPYQKHLVIEDISLYKNEEYIDKTQLKYFIDNYHYQNILIIGGCCGYGPNEMKDLITTIQSISK